MWCAKHTPLYGFVPTVGALVGEVEGALEDEREAKTRRSFCLTSPRVHSNKLSSEKLPPGHHTAFAHDTQDVELGDVRQ